MNAVAKLTTKFQVTVPMAVRRALEIKQGDTVAFNIRDGIVTLRRATPTDIAFSKAVEVTLSEWNSEADERAYRDLWPV
jgi:antitoxin PrlF